LLLKPNKQLKVSERSIRMTSNTERKYLTIGDIQKEYLPISSKKLRAWVKDNLPVKHIGRRLYIERTALESLLSSSEQSDISLD